MPQNAKIYSISEVEASFEDNRMVLLFADEGDTGWEIPLEDAIHNKGMKTYAAVSDPSCFVILSRGDMDDLLQRYKEKWFGEVWVHEKIALSLANLEETIQEDVSSMVHDRGYTPETINHRVQRIVDLLDDLRDDIEREGGIR